MLNLPEKCPAVCLGPMSVEGNQIIIQPFYLL